MFSRLKYILFDFSDNFRNDFLALLKKSIAFLIIGIFALLFAGASDVFRMISSAGIVVFGFLWGRNLFADLLGVSNAISKDFVVKIMILILAFTIGVFAGYIYFLWCLIKMAIIFFKNISKNE